MKWLQVAALGVLIGIPTLYLRSAMATTEQCLPGWDNPEPPNACTGNHQCSNGTCCSTTQQLCGFGTNPGCCGVLNYGCQDAGPATQPKCCVATGSLCHSDSDCCEHLVTISDGGLSPDVKAGVCLGDGGPVDGGTFFYCGWATRAGNSPDVIAGGGGALDCAPGTVYDSRTHTCVTPVEGFCSFDQQCQQQASGLNTTICGGTGTSGEGVCCLLPEMYCDGGAECCSGLCNGFVCDYITDAGQSCSY